MIFRQIIGSPNASLLWLMFALITFYTDMGTSLADHNRFLIYIYASYFFCYLIGDVRTKIYK